MNRLEPVSFQRHVFIDNVLVAVEVGNAAVKVVVMPVRNEKPDRFPTDLAVSLDRSRRVFVIIKDRNLGISLNRKATMI